MVVNYFVLNTARNPLSVSPDDTVEANMGYSNTTFTRATEKPQETPSQV